MVGVRVEICRFVDDAQPGWVEGRLIDADGETWSFVEKVPIVYAEYLDEASSYPQAGRIACEVAARVIRDGDREVVVIDTRKPWGVEAVGGETRFEVREEQLEEYNWT